ncbi:hypothetical protein [Aquimarina rubra]|uniref:Carboxypeptidase regulatory-like domain-containing protein n=1 Tax=Aquimarina rubra TaxID=1920033 RepID=A0ABW5LI04_9FLAO
MKKLLFKSVLILIIQFLTSCDSDDDQTLVLTTVKGRVYDVERNINIEGLEVSVLKTDCFIGCDSEFIDSAITDENGNYSITYHHIPGERYVLLKPYFESEYYTEFIDVEKEIEEGVENIKDIDAWLPVIIKLNARITNNENGPLRIFNKIIGHRDLSFISFPSHVIDEQEKDTIVYMEGRPNSQVELDFVYSTGYSNEDYHHYREIVQTSLADTLSVSYIVDCSSF